VSNFAEKILSRIPRAIESEWHQHSKGGGWVQNTAKVAETVYVGQNALVQNFW
jgi:hypothetical protein